MLAAAHFVAVLGGDIKTKVTVTFAKHSRSGGSEVTVTYFNI
jgi:hypothetical protein